MSTEKVITVVCDCLDVVVSAEMHSMAGLRREYGEHCYDCGCPIEIKLIEVEREVDPNPINFGNLGGTI